MRHCLVFGLRPLSWFHLLLKLRTEQESKASKEDTSGVLPRAVLLGRPLRRGPQTSPPTALESKNPDY